MIFDEIRSGRIFLTIKRFLAQCDTPYKIEISTVTKITCPVPNDLLSSLVNMIDFVRTLKYKVDSKNSKMTC